MMFYHLQKTARLNIGNQENEYHSEKLDQLTRSDILRLMLKNPQFLSWTACSVSTKFDEYLSF